MIHPPSPSPDDRTHREIARIAVPVSLEMVFQLALGFVDHVIVGVLGAVAIAAVGFANSLNFIAVLSLSTLGGGASILVARAFGGGDRAIVSRLTAAALVLAGAVAVLVALPTSALATPFLRFAGAPPEVAALGAPYFGIVMAALPLVVLGAVSSAVLRSLGHPRTPLVVTMLAVLVNTGLAYLLVVGPGPLPSLGVAGAAWATLAAQAFKAAALLSQLYGRRGLVSWAPPRHVAEWRAAVTPLFTLTLPLTVTEVAWSVGTFLYALLFARLSTGALAASQIVNTLEGIFVVGSFGLMSAATALIGQAVGRGDAGLARHRARTVVRVTVLTGAGFGVLFALTAFLLPVFYPKVGADVLHVAFWGVLINGAFQVVKVQNMVRGGGVLPSGGDTRGVLLGDAVSAFLVGLPLAWLLAFPLGLGPWGLFAARIVEEVVKLGIFWWRGRRVRWTEVAAAA